MVDPIFYEKVIGIAVAGLDFFTVWFIVQKLSGKRHD